MCVEHWEEDFVYNEYLQIAVQVTLVYPVEHLKMCMEMVRACAIRFMETEYFTQLTVTTAQ